jgi:hypothetical protein
MMRVIIRTSLLTALLLAPSADAQDPPAAPTAPMPAAPMPAAPMPAAPMPAAPMPAQHDEAGDAEQADASDAERADAPADEEAKPSWEMAFSGYFRAPIMMSLSRRPSPGENDQRQLQVVHAPNRLMDAGYSSFAYTRLQEGDWGELYVTAKRPHVEATIAFMGYWYAWAGYENGNASWVPAQAWVDLDSDVKLGALTPHVDLKGGVFWQRWGMFDKYDTYLFGRFHQAGGALEVHLPIGGAEARVVEGFGTNRNGVANVATGLTLLHYTHVGIKYRKLIDIGAYHNISWTRDPTLFIPPGMEPAAPLPAPGPDGEPGGGSNADAREAHMNVYGADINLRLPHVGHAWLAASRISLKNGWALPGIVEVMHSPGGSGLANNYMGYGEVGSTGSGTMSNLAGLYENSLRELGGQSQNALPNLALSAFGMFTHARRELLPEATVPERLMQLKWGSDLTLKMLPWLSVMMRYDSVDLDAEADGRAFRVVTPRLIFTSHVMSTESIWLQYSRYFYDDDVLLEASASQPYPNPDRNVIKLQANMSF